MNIITTDQLAETLLKEIFAELYNQYRELHSSDSYEDMTSFDDWLWKNIEDLGYQVYAVIGERYGDVDSMAESILED